MVDLSHIQDVEVDRWIADREAGKPWYSVDNYRTPPDPTPRTEPQECPSCSMISRFFVDDYICCACRDRNERINTERTDG